MYSGKVSWEKQAIHENCIHEFHVLVDKDRAIALIHENNIHEIVYFTHPRKFSSSKIYRYYYNNYIFS